MEIQKPFIKGEMVNVALKCKAFFAKSVVLITDKQYKANQSSDI